MWRSLFRPDGFLRQEMLTIYLILVSVTTFLGYLFTPMQAVSQANLVVSVLGCVFLPWSASGPFLATWCTL